MEKEKVLEKTCEKCNTKLHETDVIFNGYCEKCYNKWIKRRTKKPKDPYEKSHQPVMATYACVCGIIAIALLIVTFIMLLPFAPILFLSIFTFGTDPVLNESLRELSSIFLVLKITRYVFAITGLTLAMTSIDKHGKSKMSKAGIVLSVISLILFCFGI